MKEVIVLAGQCIIDIAIQELGDASRAFELCKLNNKSITASLLPGEIIMVPEVALDKKPVVKVFTDPANKPASSVTDAEGNLSEEGIDYWTIEDDFIVQ